MTPHKQTIKVDNFLIQMSNAEKFMSDEHERLIKEGFIWDGMDGYTAPKDYDMAKFYKLMSQ